MTLRLIVDNDAAFQNLLDRAPDFPVDVSISRRGGCMAEVSDGIYTIYDKPSELAFSLARDLLEEAVKYELEVRKGGHPLLQEVRKKRYLAADPVDMIDLAQKLQKWGRLMKKKGY